MKSIVNYFDNNGALRSALFVRRVKRGSKKGQVVVRHLDGSEVIPKKIRNIEGDSETLF